MGGSYFHLMSHDNISHWDIGSAQLLMRARLLHQLEDPLTMKLFHRISSYLFTYEEKTKTLSYTEHILNNKSIIKAYEL